MSAIINFNKLWEEGAKTGKKFLIFGSEQKEEPLKKKVYKAKYQLRKQIDKIGFMINKLKERDEHLFNKLVDALINHDQLRSKMLAAEIAEIRKLAKTLMITQVALERVEYRLDLFLTIGETASTLAPVVPVINMLRTQLMKEIPEIGIELSNIHEELEDVINSMNFYGAVDGDVVLSSEARKIMEEAKAIAEQQMKEEFPNVNVGIQNTKVA
ncbi:hypothetical protein IPA_00070 [Ignicoccus pacificus DSM 13166]|uniref:Uncharacterized protein n=1 Tax=Ignicoccus pacificus DSM 13166 TaxID=940294 RepID=A0A977PJP1_9CREN|nr:hypothetical protein IPA_00070 [Ignicoccus pacificus DSM 13166]